MVLFCAAIKSDAFSLLGLFFLSHVQLNSCAISVVFRLKELYNHFPQFCFLMLNSNTGNHVTVSKTNDLYSIELITIW